MTELIYGITLGKARCVRIIAVALYHELQKSNENINKLDIGSQ